MIGTPEDDGFYPDHLKISTSFIIYTIQLIGMARAI